MAADAAGLARELNLGATHVVGASMGGMIAQTLAARHPDSTRSLVSIMSNTGNRWKGQPAFRIYRYLLRRAPEERAAFIEYNTRLFEAIGSRGLPFDRDRVREMVARSYDRGRDPAGPSRQLGAIVAYRKRSRIPLIAMTRRNGSSLAEAADVTLLLPAIAEACPMGLAPTTSTTMMIALGDALAVALLERKGFSASDFKALHPGGRLGRRLLRVSDIMHGAAAVPLVELGTGMSEAILVMTAKSFGCVPLGSSRRKVNGGWGGWSLVGWGGCQSIWPAAATAKATARITVLIAPGGARSPGRRHLRVSRAGPSRRSPTTSKDCTSTRPSAA